MKQVITVSREFGSGGREIGIHLAERLGIPFYDKELISMAADDSDIAEHVFADHDETVPGSEIYSGYLPFSPIYQVSMSDEIFFAQSKVIRRLAEQGPCVIAGRCADMILEHSVNLFIYADMKKRVERMLSLEPGSDPDKMEERIRQIDVKRKDYYQYYTGNIWGRAQNYHLCLDCGKAGLQGGLNAVLAYVEAFE